MSPIWAKLSVQVVLQHRIDGRNDRLQRIVEKVRHAQSPQNAECDAGRSPASVPIHRKIVLNGSSVAVRSSPFRKRQNPASGGSRRKIAQRYAFLPCIQPNPGANLRAPCRGVRRFATSGLFLRSLRRNTVPHAPGPVGRSVRSRTGARQSRRPPRKPGAAFSCRNIPEPSAKNSPDYFPPLTQRTENAFCCGKFIFALGLATAVVAKPRKDPFSPLASSPVQ